MDVISSPPLGFLLYFALTFSSGSRRGQDGSAGLNIRVTRRISKHSSLTLPHSELTATLLSQLDQLKLVVLLLVSVPLAALFPYLPSTSPSLSKFPTYYLAHLYAILPSVLFLCFVLDLRRGFFELVLSSLITWVLVKAGVALKWGQKMPWIVFTAVMGHLGVNHYMRYMDKTPLTTIEITGSQMVLCMKLITFAWNVYDGTKPESELDAAQKQTAIRVAAGGKPSGAVPGLLEFLGYCLFFPSILAGPTFTYNSYISFTSHHLFLSETHTNSTKLSNPPSSYYLQSSIPPGRRTKALKRFATGLFFLGIYSVWAWEYGYDRILEPNFLYKRWYQRVGFMNLAGFIARTKYYAVWCIAESAFIISGLGYSPETGKYDAMRNVRIRSIELAPNFKVLLDSWNCGTNKWLHSCIYKRVARKGKKPGFKSAQITFLTSALWHGINPCYIMTFILGGFAQSLGRSFRTLVRPFFLPPTPPAATPKPSSSTAGTVPITTSNGSAISFKAPPQTPLKWVYDVIGIIGTQLVLNFIVAPFMLLEMWGSLEAWKRVGYYGLFLIFIPWLSLNVGSLKKVLKTRLRERNARLLEGTTSEDEKETKKMEEARLEWERKVELKRRLRGEGVASMGLDIEELAEEDLRGLLEKAMSGQLHQEEGKKEL